MHVSVINTIKKDGRESFLLSAKNLTQSIDSSIDFEKIVEPILGLLYDSLNEKKYDTNLFASTNPKTKEKFIKKYVDKIIKGYNRRPSVASSIAILPVDDPAIIKLAEAIETRFNVTEIMHNYKIINRLSTLHGEVLEEYIFSKVESGMKWYLAWGESVRNTDFFNIETGKLVQVKNKDTTANADAHKNKKMLVDAGYDIDIWWRLKSSTGETNWDELNKILELESNTQKLSETDYHKFIDKLIMDNADAFKLKKQDLIPNDALRMMVNIGKKISDSRDRNLGNTDNLPIKLFEQNISEDFFHYFKDHKSFSLKSYGVLFSTLKYYSTMYGENWKNLVKVIRNRLDHIPLEIDSIVSGIAPNYTKKFLDEGFNSRKYLLAWANEKDVDMDEIWDEIYSKEDKKLFQTWKMGGI
jgi:transcriptional regulator of met regulon